MRVKKQYRGRRRGRKIPYSLEKLEEAVDAILSKRMNYLGAQIFYNIPAASICNAVKKRTNNLQPSTKNSKSLKIGKN